MPRYSSIPALALAAGATLALASCASLQPPSIPRVTQVAASPAVVAQRVSQEMKSLGFLVTQGTGPNVIGGTSEGTPAGWAYCPAAFVTDPDGRRQKEFPVTASGSSVEVTLTPANGGTRVHVGSTFTGSFFDGATGYSDTSSCHSEGVVEGKLLKAAQG